MEQSIVAEPSARPKFDILVDRVTAEVIKRLAAVTVAPEPSTTTIDCAAEVLHFEDDQAAVADLSGKWPWNLTDLRFGHLTVGERSQRLGWWRCRCDCGCSKEMPRKRLVGGVARSCSAECSELPTLQPPAEAQARTS
jgi:hypothetical protein